MRKLYEITTPVHLAGNDRGLYFLSREGDIYEAVYAEGTNWRKILGWRPVPMVKIEEGDVLDGE